MNELDCVSAESVPLSVQVRLPGERLGKNHCRWGEIRSIIVSVNHRVSHCQSISRPTLVHGLAKLSMFFFVVV